MSQTNKSLTLEKITSEIFGLRFEFDANSRKHLRANCMGNTPAQFGLIDAHYSKNVVALRTWSDEGDSPTKLTSLHPGVDDVGMSALRSSTSDSRV